MILPKTTGYPVPVRFQHRHRQCVASGPLRSSSRTILRLAWRLPPPCCFAWVLLILNLSASGKWDRAAAGSVRECSPRATSVLESLAAFSAQKTRVLFQTSDSPAVSLGPDLITEHQVVSLHISLLYIYCFYDETTTIPLSGCRKKILRSSKPLPFSIALTSPAKSWLQGTTDRNSSLLPLDSCKIKLVKPSSIRIAVNSSATTDQLDLSLVKLQLRIWPPFHHG